MIKIFCRCCGQTAEVTGRSEYRSLAGCSNGTAIDQKAKITQIIGRDKSLILFWDQAKKAYEPLLTPA